MAECLPARSRWSPRRPTVVKVPEGVGDNVDLSVPKANLWICELGPCAGPGEGALRVVEHATDVLDGLGAYEFTVEYDNFVISSVNPCDIVFGPGGAGDDRGPVDEKDESAINPDCAPDPGPGGGTCSYSHILENVIHFGCATAGQAPGPTGDMDLASLLLIPHEDLVNDLFPGNENGVLTVIKDNGCELVDILGHPVSGSINGGLVPVCGNLAVTVRILEGDLDLNCEVNVTDAQIIAGKYGAFFGSLLYSKWYDLEPALHDLDIDIKDIQKVFGRDGSNCQDAGAAAAAARSADAVLAASIIATNMTSGLKSPLSSYQRQASLRGIRRMRLRPDADIADGVRCREGARRVEDGVLAAEAADARDGDGVVAVGVDDEEHRGFSGVGRGVGRFPQHDAGAFDLAVDVGAEDGVAVGVGDAHEGERFGAALALLAVTADLHEVDDVCGRGDGCRRRR